MKKSVTFYLEQEILDELLIIAIQRGTTPSQVIREAVRTMVKSQTKPDPIVSLKSDPISIPGSVLTEGDMYKHRQFFKEKGINIADVLRAHRSKSRGRPYDTSMEPYFIYLT